MALLNAGTSWRSAWTAPQRFSLRIYVPARDLDGIYLPLVPHAVAPEDGGMDQLSEQLARLAAAEDGVLPPRTDPLWTLRTSDAPAAARQADGPVPDLPVYHPSQRLRRSLQLLSAAEEGQDPGLVPLLLPEDEVRARAETAAPEHFLPVYARQADWSVPMSWFGLFREDDLVRTAFQGRTVHRLLSPAGPAAQRAQDAARTVTGLQREDVAPLGDELQRLSRWVGSFGEGSLVSLDYGTIADPLQPDESPRDMEDAIALAAEGDLQGAAVAMGRLAHRWFPLAQLEYAS